MQDRELLLSTLRDIVSQDSWPISAQDWKNSNNTNCLAFALGLDVSNNDFQVLFGNFAGISGMNNILSGENISKEIIIEIFKKTCSTIGLKCRVLTSLNLASKDEYVIGIFGLYPIVPKSFDYYGTKTYSYDFHFVRRDLDGTWVHKPSFGSNNVPEKVEWKYLQLFYPEKPIYFGVKK